MKQKAPYQSLGQTFSFRLSAMAFLLTMFQNFGSKINVGVHIRRGCVTPNIFLEKSKKEVEHTKKIF